MGFRDVSVTEVREALRCWLDGVGLRIVAERAGLDRKAAHRSHPGEILLTTHRCSPGI